MTDESSRDRRSKTESQSSDQDTVDSRETENLDKTEQVLRQLGNQTVQRMARDRTSPRGSVDPEAGRRGTGTGGSLVSVSRVPTNAVVHRQVDQPRDEKGRFAEKERPDSDKKYSIDRRPEYASGQEEAVWQAAKESGLDDKVRDPNTGEVLTWDRSKSRFRQWHMGHKDGREYRVLLKYYLRGIISEERFKQEYQDPGHYRPEKPVPNMSGTYEGSGEYWQEEFGPLDQDGDQDG